MNKDDKIKTITLKVKKKTKAGKHFSFILHVADI